jgi:G3E family GTPase
MPVAITRLILVGGFLGAGKTTLLKEAAQRLTARGQRVALLANDQAADLVDTAVLEETGAAVDEVAGGCFCCRFPDMMAAIERLRQKAQPHCILAEPVGSCTDLSATVLQPLKQIHGKKIALAPFSVLIDVKQVRVLLQLHQAAGGAGGGFPDEVLYIYRKQIEEADVIVINKADLVSPAELTKIREALDARFPAALVVTVSALTGEGVDAWLELLDANRSAGQKIVDVDYDVYAAGEAALGWMNAAAQLRTTTAADWSGFARRLLETIRDRVVSSGGQIGHLKLYLSAPGQGHVAGNATANDSPIAVGGDLSRDVRQAALLLNARVRIHADQLREIAEAALRAVANEQRVVATITNMRSFFPSRPQPIYRFSEVGGG